MAEATDRPADAATGVAPADAVPGAADAAPAEAPAAEAAPKPYSTVSVLAVVGFSLAALYALIIAVAGLVALVTKTPLLLPLALAFVPLAALVVSFAARMQVRASEGTLSGLRLTAWGVGLSLFFGLVYSAYYAATYFAVTLQARESADGWFGHIGNPGEDGHLEKAFRLTLPPEMRPRDDADLRKRLELDHNRPAGKHDSLSEFRQDFIVRLVQQGGDQTHWEYVGVQDWHYEADGYHVTLTYHLTTPFTANDVQVMLIGNEGRDDPRRQWRVLGCQAPPGMEDKILTAEGRRMVELKTAAARFASEWAAKEFRHRKFEAFADTLSPADRERLKAAREKLDAARDESARRKLAEADKECKEFLDGLAAYEAGALVRADYPTVYWAPDGKVGDVAVRDDIVAKVKKLFDKGEWPERKEAFTLQMTTFPTYSKDASGERLGYDVQIGTMKAEPQKNKAGEVVGTTDVPEYAVEARLDVENTAPGGKVSDAKWRIVGLELISGRTGDRARGGLSVANPPPPQQQPR